MYEKSGVAAAKDLREKPVLLLPGKHFSLLQGDDKEDLAAVLGIHP